MRLAETWQCPVSEVLSRADSAELSRWQAWERVNGPLGRERVDHLAAMIAQLIAEIYRNRRARLKPFTRGEFMLWKENQHRPASEPDDILTMLLALFPPKSTTHGSETHR